ncbi:MAG: polysaccharide biosynthesis tyrosine autokinase [Xanthomonadales bacterium]|nr:polysaccharide biosynthesis tyrosine autokinase [Xanthomonadales bacterium]MCC6561291.1 polysaccharide biosynthesis tyrosine autokinase [Xanthomonadales bacterium]
MPAAAVTPSSLLAELRQAEHPGEEETNLLDYWRMLVKRKWTVLAAALLVTLFGLVDTLLTVPMYRATSTIQIEGEQLNVVNMEGVTPGESSGDNQFYETQYQLLRSRSLAERVATTLQLGSDTAVVGPGQPSPWRRLFGSLFGAGKSSAPDKASAAKAVDDRAHASTVQDGLTVDPVRSSRLVRLHFDSPDPAFAARVVNAVGEAYISTNLERRFGASSYAKGYLEDRLAQLKLKLEESEKQLVEFAQREEILSIDNEAIANQDVVSLNGAVSEAQRARFQAEARWRQIEALGTAVLPHDMLEQSMVRSLQERRNALRATYQEKLRVYKPEYPEMRQLRAQLDEVDQQIAIEAGNIKKTVKAQYDAAVTLEQMLREQLAKVKADTLDLQKRSIDYKFLQREVATNRELYDGLLQRYKEIGVAGGVTSNNISVVDNAQVPRSPFEPNISRNLMKALLIGLFLGVLLALLLEYLDDTIKTPEDIEKRLHLVHLGVVPKLGKELSPHQASLDLRSGFAEAYRSVRTALQFSTESGVPSTLVVTSTVPGEGKTTTAKTLARNFAMLGKRVLLIDADLRNPSLHRAFDLDNSLGLSNCLSGAAKPGQCIHRVEEAGISVMLSGPLPPNPAELLAGPRMISLLTQAAERFDQIVIDAPPVLGLADAPILSNLAKGTLLVVESGRARIGAGQAAIKRLLGARARLLGAVLTKFDSRSSGYGYGYGGYGYESYQYYGYGGAPKKLAGRR